MQKGLIMEDTVTKKISFYKLILRKKEEDINPVDVFSHIKSLDFTNEGRYYRIKDGKSNLLKFHNEKIEVDIPLKLIFGVTKKKDLPCLEEKGETEPLQIEDKGLFEPIHIILFSNNIMGVESNYHGPRATGLKAYIYKKARSYVDDVEVLPLAKPDFLEYISKIGEIKLFELYVHRDSAKVFEEASKSISHTLQEVSKGNNAQTVGIVLQSPKPIRANWHAILNIFNKEKVRDSTQKAVIRAVNQDTNKVESFNLLDPFIISTKEVVRHDDKYRRVDSKSMFTAIKESFIEKQSEIEGITNPHANKQKNLDNWKE